MSEKLEKKIRKEARNKLSHEFEVLRQMMKMSPSGSCEYLGALRILFIALIVTVFSPKRGWEIGLRLYFKEEIDYAPHKHYGVDLPSKENGAV